MTLPPNTMSGVSNVHEARLALGKRLRELRTAARLSGRQLAESLSWPASKVSKIENGRQTPSDDDIRGWTATAHCEDQTDALLASLHSLEIQHAEWQRILRAGIRPRQNELLDLDLRTRLLPGLRGHRHPRTAADRRVRQGSLRRRYPGLPAQERHQRSDPRPRAATGDSVPAGQAVSFRADRSGATDAALSACGHARPARPADLLLSPAQRAARHHRLPDAVRHLPVAWLLALRPGPRAWSRPTQPP